jgi:hypothetical protein
VLVLKPKSKSERCSSVSTRICLQAKNSKMLDSSTGCVHFLCAEASASWDLLSLPLSRPLGDRVSFSSCILHIANRSSLMPPFRTEWPKITARKTHQATLTFRSKRGSCSSCNIRDKTRFHPPGRRIVTALFAITGSFVRVGLSLNDPGPVGTSEQHVRPTRCVRGA